MARRVLPRGAGAAGGGTLPPPLLAPPGSNSGAASSETPSVAFGVNMAKLVPWNAARRPGQKDEGAARGRDRGLGCPKA